MNPKQVLKSANTTGIGVASLNNCKMDKTQLYYKSVFAF